MGTNAVALVRACRCCDLRRSKLLVNRKLREGLAILGSGLDRLGI